MYRYIFLILNCVSTSWCSKLGNLIFYFIYLTGIFILTPLTSLFRLGVSLLCYRFYSSDYGRLIRPYHICRCLLSSNPLDMFWKKNCVYFIFYYLIWEIYSMYLLSWDFRMSCLILTISKRTCVLWLYKLWFFYRGFDPFFK